MKCFISSSGHLISTIMTNREIIEELKRCGYSQVDIDTDRKVAKTFYTYRGGFHINRLRLTLHQPTPIYSKESGAPSNGRLRFPNTFPFYRSYVAGNDSRITSIFYGLAKQVCNFSLIGILSRAEFTNLSQYIGNIAGVAYKCVVGPIGHILECTAPGEKNHIEDG